MRSPILAAVLLISCSSTVIAAEFDYSLELKANYRDSEHARFPTAFPFPPEALPIGETRAHLETVDEGQHFEVSMLSFAGRWRFANNFSAQMRIEAIDRYERNPSSTDHELGIDTLILRYGNKSRALSAPERNSFYLQTGKFEKFERQRARRTESYGLASNAFNRFEDSGFEAGFDLKNGFYSRASFTSGNPVFIRDPNVLAGDNGTEERSVPPNNPNPKLKSGIVILYDAEVEEFNLSDHPELGLGAGWRFNSANQQRFDALAFYYQRELARNKSIHGTSYGTDLDLFDLGEVPGAEGIRLPAEGDEKTEYGFNIWYEVGNFALFGQWVEQDMAGLKRSGQEVELSYVLDWKFPITPVLRYSNLDPQFSGTGNYPAPSVWWDWQKIDYGLNIHFSDHVQLILEYADNSFIRAGTRENNNEALLTLILRYP
jgi:hypothetical protein